ncbi:MAG: VOC family protein [Chitinophagaceae bacterium]|nr:VOC family protein [Chitinophagaceae bacterium]
MLTAVHPKLPMRSKTVSRQFYVNALGFTELGDPDFQPYLMVRRDLIELHFFEFKELNPLENYGQIYVRTDDVDQLYNKMIAVGIPIHPNGQLETKSWGQREFSLLDPDNNLITFGQAV